MREDLEKLNQAWQSYVYDRKIKESLDEKVKNSWKRCLKDYQVDPFGEIKTEVLQQLSLQNRVDKLEKLIKIAVPIMKDLYLAIENSEFTVVLTDADGYILKIIGGGNFMKLAKSLYLIEGANWHEKSKGTNAIGTVIEEQKPLSIYASEHLFEQNQLLTCSAAPIFDAKDNFVGVLNISGNYRDAHWHTLGMVISAAKLINNQLIIDSMKQKIDISQKKEQELLYSVSKGLITLNRRGIITQINRRGSEILGTSFRNCIGNSIEEFFLNSEFSVLKGANLKFPTSPKEVNCKLKKANYQVSAKLKPIYNSDDKLTDMIVEIEKCKDKKDIKNQNMGWKTEYSFENIVGESKAIKNAINIAKKVSTSDSTILLIGESGTGKELLAQSIHNRSFRRDEAFVTLNCGVISDDLLVSELFGYEEGAFTGAKQEGKKGKFELANGGTIFLDEIAEMSLNNQVKLLRVLQEKKFSPLGSNNIIPVDIRVIAASNKDLRKLIEENKFREDLYYRLNVIQVDVPPLRERGEDIIILARHLINKFSKIFKRDGIKLSPTVQKIFKNYDWPGNVRELENVIERVLNLVEGEEIKASYLPKYLQNDNLAKTKENDELLSLQEAEAKAIKRVVEYFEGNITKSASYLEIARSTLYNKLQKYQIEIAYD